MSVSTAASEHRSRSRRGARCVLLLGWVGAAGPASGQLPENPTSLTVASVSAGWIETGAGDAAREPVPEAVSRLISVRPGDRYRPLAVRQSVKQIFALGRFRDVRVRSEPLPNGEVRLRFELDPISRIAGFRISGAPSGTRLALAGVLDLGVGEPLPDLDARARAAEAWLRSAGYLAAEVDLLATPAGRDLEIEAQVVPGPRARVASIRIEGVEESLGGELGRVFGITPGQVWSEEVALARLPEVEARLRDRGLLAGVANLDFVPGDSGEVQVTLTVQPGPRVSVAVEGFPARSRSARDVRAALSERTLSSDSIEEVRGALLTELRRDGHRDAEVVARSEISADRLRQTIRFTGRPGTRFVIADAAAEGAPQAQDDRVATALAPFRPGRPFREDEWRAAAEGLRRVLRRQGYFAAEVEPAVLAIPGDPGAVRLVARIRSGPFARVRAVRFEDPAPFSAAELEGIVRLPPGAPYVVEEIVTARDALEAFYRDRGFLEAAVEVEAPVERDSFAAEVVFSVRSGRYFTVGAVIVAGLDATRESVIRSRLPFENGDPLGRGDLLEIRRRLAGLGIFSTVEVELLEPEEPVSEHNVLIRVVEGSRTRLGYGAGYSEREQVRGEVEWTRQNLFGRAHTGSFFVRLSARGNRVVATYRGAESAAGDAPVFVSAFREEQDRESFDFIRTGAGVQLSRRVFGRDLFLRYDFTTSELFDLEIHPNQIDRSFADDLWLSVVSVAVVSDTRDDPLDPRRGRFGILDLEWSSRLLGSRAPFVKGFGQQFLFFPIGERVVLSVAGRLGLAWTLGEGEPALVPITERFFAGGATTLRGFELDRAGPLDERGFPLGGNLLVIGNIEVRFPIFGSLRGAVFSDHGGVYSEVRSFRAENLNHDVGAGLRWNTPVGPIRFDYGIRIGDIGEESRGRWHFTIGHAF